MQMIRPITVDETVMPYINVPEDDAPEWESGSYDAGDRVIITSTHLVYESLSDNNSSNPETGVDSVPPSWAIVGATRPWRLYDERVRNVVSALEPYDPAIYNAYYDGQATAEGIAFDLVPGMLTDSLALLNIDGVFANVLVETPGDGRVYESRVPLSGGLEESTWHAYFYTPIDRLRQLILTDLPASLDATIRVSIEGAGAPVQIGEVIAGRAIGLGETQYGSGTGIVDYSKKERDEFGNLRIVERRYTKLVDYRINLDRLATDAVADVLAEARAQPTLFIGTAEHSSLTVYGVYRDMRITFDNYSISEATIEVEEV